MGTSPDTGTPDGCIRDGWQNYMDDCYPPGPGQGFTTRLVYAANIGRFTDDLVARLSPDRDDTQFIEKILSSSAEAVLSWFHRR
jgi:hypothetical protein